MIVLIVIVAGVAWAALSIGIPWPLAVVGGFVAPLVGSTIYLKSTNRDAPTSSLTPNDARTERFLRRLCEAYRALGYTDGASRADAILKAYEKAEFESANRLLRSLSSTVANSAASTTLIAAWQNAWRKSGS